MSLDVHSSGIIIVDDTKTPHIIPIINVIYDLNNLTLWKVDREPIGIVAQRLDDWLAENIDSTVYPGLPLFRLVGFEF